ncbi:hypothetical protein [Corynebacterium casei]|uniref:hypothetical protein n=1 Tax=Corynebacterium casei TaxID=160386 RepID=UPI003F8E00E1
MDFSTSYAQWWGHALTYGSIAVLLSGAMLLVVLFLTPDALIDDYPEDIRQAAPSPTAGQKRAGLISGIVFVIVLFSSITGVVWAWGAQHPQASYLELALMTFVLSVMFALFDLIIIDWLIICTWRPKALVYPGTEDCAGWRDYGFHVKEQLQPKALLVLVGASSVVGLLVWWLT